MGSFLVRSLTGNHGEANRKIRTDSPSWRDLLVHLIPASHRKKTKLSPSWFYISHIREFNFVIMYVLSYLKYVPTEVLYVSYSKNNMFSVSHHKRDISLLAQLLPRGASGAWQVILQRLTSSGQSCLLGQEAARRAGSYSRGWSTTTMLEDWSIPYKWIYPLVSSNMAGTSPNWMEVLGKVLIKWSMFHCHAWLPEGKWMVFHGKIICKWRFVALTLVMYYSLLVWPWPIEPELTLLSASCPVYYASFTKGMYISHKIPISITVNSVHMCIHV